MGFLQGWVTTNWENIINLREKVNAYTYDNINIRLKIKNKTQQRKNVHM